MELIVRYESRRLSFRVEKDGKGEQNWTRAKSSNNIMYKKGE
jgi:hypothetical protein